jgi:hypothetical protein
MVDKRIDRERWAKRSINEQMGNIGADIGRAISAHRSGDEYREQCAVERALDLFSATAETVGNYRRLREILRARECFLALFYDGRFEEDADAVERYFMQFALAARAEHYAKQAARQAADEQ